mgnify:CR=1 FL=1
MEFTSKQRSNLRSMAQSIEPVTQIGKGGVSDALIETLSKALDKRELIKISVLDNADSTAQDFAEKLAALTASDVVCVIGRKIVLYRKSKKTGVKHVEF